MKISKIRNLVIGAMVATIVTGCGGSGASLPDNAFKTGIYLSQKSPSSLQYMKDMMGDGAYEVNLPVGYAPDSMHLSSANQLYVGSGNTLICYQNKVDAPSMFVFPQDTSPTFVKGIATDSLGRIYVNDFSNRRIMRIDNMNGDNLTILDFKPYLAFSSEDNLSLAIDSQNRIYIAPRTSNQIFRFNSMTDGNPTKFGTTGGGVNQFFTIYDIAFDSSDRMYIVDRNNDRIVRMDDMNGTNWITFGTNGTGVNQFNTPVNISIGSDNSICVGDPLNGRIVRFADMVGSNWSTYGSTITNLSDILVR
jgi:hypothetical protein